MSAIRESTCRSCGCVVFWAVTEANARRMPMDWDGDDSGVFWICHNDDGVGGDVRVPLAVHRNSRKPAHRLMRRGRRLSHFATCPDRDKWRK